MKTTILIGLGSFLGGAARYLISKTIQEQVQSSFPFGTFTVNLIGCFLIGLIMGWSVKSNLDTTWTLFLTTGILGGFTTFSAFSMESIKLLHTGHVATGITYIVLSVLIGLTGTLAGWIVMR